METGTKFFETKKFSWSIIFFKNPKTIAYLILFWKEELFPFF